MVCDRNHRFQSLTGNGAQNERPEKSSGCPFVVFFAHLFLRNFSAPIQRDANFLNKALWTTSLSM
jgi:hypothetical protein